MADEGIFLIQDGGLTVLESQPYDNEALLQEALASFPEVLAGGTTAGSDEKRRLVLIRREMGIATTDGGPATFSLDHLFVADDAVPVIVEVKRSSDTRIRREVVGQMLDYAANAVMYWPISDLRTSLEQNAAASGSTGDKVLLDAFGVDVEEFWKQVEGNLRSGRVRMVFVADRLPAELIRIIEFLNEQMSPAEVLGVELPQYVGKLGHQVLVPRLVGRTSSAVATKQSATGTPWDEQSYLDFVREHYVDEMADLVKDLFDHVATKGMRMSWGRGVSPGVSGWYEVSGTTRALWTANGGAAAGNARPYVYFYLPEIHQLLAPPAFEAFIAHLRSIPSYKSRIDAAEAEGYASKYPSLFLNEIVHRPSDVTALFAALDLFSGGK